jgi:hypothetical protein
VQLRFETTLTFDEYVTQRGWEQASLPGCPLCAPGTTCGFQRLGTYIRKVPAIAYVTRFYCPEQHTTFGLLPDFYASRMPGTLDAIEETAAAVEAAPSLEAAAHAQRPAELDDAVTIAAAIAWTRRRVAMVRLVLLAVIGVLPSLFEGCAPTVSSFRRRLGTTSALMALRGIVEGHLHALPRPLGLNPGREGGAIAREGYQQSTGPDPPYACG